MTAKCILPSKDKGAKQKVSKDDVSRQVLLYSQHEREGIWSTLPEDPKQKPAPNYNAPVTVINGHITLVGGRDAETDNITNVLSTWHEDKHQWENIDPPPMPTVRLASGVCHYDNFLLVVGGVVDDTKRELVKTVNVYKFSTRKWSTPKALDLPISQLRSPHVAVFKEHVYVIGGATTYPSPPEKGEAQYNPYAWRARWSDVKEAVREAEDMDAHTSAVADVEPSNGVETVWSNITDPPALRPTVVSCKDSLILVGGVKGGEPQKGIYEFIDEKNVDGTVGSWRPVGSMSEGRYRHAAVLLGSRGAALLVAGGCMLDNPRGNEKHENTLSAELVFL